MPKITIYEQDFTGSGNSNALDQAVLIPGRATLGESGGPEDGDDYLLDTVDDLKEFIGDDEEDSELKKDTGYQMAKALLGVGASVVYAVVDTPDKDKEDVESGGYENTRDPNWWQRFEDKGVYGLRFITTGGDDDVNANKYAAKAAAERGDATALMHLPDDIAKDYKSAYDYVNEAPKSGESNLTDFGEVTRGKDEKGNLIKEPVSKYAAGYVPNFDIINAKATQKFHFPGYVAYLGCYAANVNRTASWFAMAGSSRGRIPWDVQFDANFGELATDKLQNRETEGVVALNPIRPVRNYGNLVWGNRTMFPVSKGANSDIPGLTASSFLNIRMLLCDIKKKLYDVSRKYTFDPNSSVLWTRFYNSVTPLLEDMKTNQGIKGYKLTQVKDVKKATLRAVLRIVPIEAVEDFVFNIELADSIEVTEGE